MKKLFILPFILLGAMTACSDDSCSDDSNKDEVTPSHLVTPELAVRLADTQTPMTGIVEAYACKPGSSIYYGNYLQNKLTPFPGYYKLMNGEVYGKSNRLLTLPIGPYNIVYWGTPKAESPIYSDPVVLDPAITLGGNLDEQFYKLRRMPADTTYYPTFDLVYAVNSIDIGVEDLNASLQRVVAGLKVIVKNTDNSALSNTIAGMNILIGSIAGELNMYTAEPADQTCTVKFPLAPSADGHEMSNATVMLFPSGPRPLLTLLINFKNGNVKTFRQQLTGPLRANNQLTLTLTLGDIFSDQTSGSFTVEKWEEENQTITVPPLN